MKQTPHHAARCSAAAPPQSDTTQPNPLVTLALIAAYVALIGFVLV